MKKVIQRYKHIVHKPHHVVRHALWAFTLVEMLIVITIVWLLLAFLSSKVRKAESATYKRRAISDIRVMIGAMEMYKSDNQWQYPPDASRNIPVGLEKYVGWEYVNRWPDAPRPASIYDRDAWLANTLLVPQQDVYQISIRFCPAWWTIDTCRFPEEKRASGFNVNSAVYYCMQWPCRSHQAEAYTYPWHCMNCNGE